MRSKVNLPQLKKKCVGFLKPLLSNYPRLKFWLILAKASLEKKKGGLGLPILIVPSCIWRMRVAISMTIPEKA